LHLTKAENPFSLPKEREKGFPPFKKEILRKGSLPKKEILQAGNMGENVDNGAPTRKHTSGNSSHICFSQSFFLGSLQKKKRRSRVYESSPGSSY